MSDETTTMRLWFVNSLDTCRLFSLTEKPTEGSLIRVPHSVITHVSYEPDKPGQLRECRVTIKDWWVEKWMDQEPQ